MDNMAKIKVKKYLSSPEYSNRLEQIESSRDYVLFKVLWDLALRVSEALAIRQEDINFEQRIVNIYSLKKKGESIRVLPLEQETLRKISLILDPKKKKGKIFNIGRKMAYVLSIKYFGMNPHAIRHSRAIDLIVNGRNIEVVRRLLGHSRIDITQIYLDFDYETMRKELSMVQLAVPNKESKIL